LVAAKLLPIDQLSWSPTRFSIEIFWLVELGKLPTHVNTAQSFLENIFFFLQQVIEVVIFAFKLLWLAIWADFGPLDAKLLA